MSGSLRILAETAYPHSAPGSRVRLASFAPFLAEHAVDLDYRPQLTDYEYELLTSAAPVRSKAIAAINSSRRLLAPKRDDYDLHMVYRVRALVPMPGLEPLSGIDVYDFDDALFLGSISRANERYRWLKRESERWLRYMKGARLVIAGNAFLADRARQYARRVEIVPSCIDRDAYEQRVHADTDCLTVGWIGSRSTSDYLAEIIPALDRINCDRVRMRLVLVGADINIARPWVEQRPWSLATEKEDLASFDVGIMPLPEDDWARGKCGYKLLQYFAAGVPVISSPVGVNCTLIDEGRGLSATSTSEWVDALETLAADTGMRREIGALGHDYAGAEYSYQRWAPDFAEILASARIPAHAPPRRPLPTPHGTRAPRVLHLLPCDDWGGTEVQISTQVLLTDPAECEQAVVILQPPGVVYERLQAGGVPVYSIGSRVGLVGSLRQLARILRSSQFDAIEAYGLKAGILARIAVRLGPRIPVVIGVRGLHFTSANEEGVGLNTRTVLRLERALSRWVHTFDANSRGARNFLVANGFDSRKFTVIVNGVQTNSVPMASHDHPGPPKIICVARFVPLKRHELLLRALAEVKARGVDFRCELIGYGPSLDHCRALAEELGLAEQVTFAGRVPQEEIRRRLADADLFALVSIWEGMPGSVLEAMAAGLPVVGTDVNGTNEVVVDGDTGLLVPPDDLDALRTALLTLIEDRDLRVAMGARGRERVEDRFSFERVVAEKVAFYATVAGRPVTAAVPDYVPDVDAVSSR